MQRFEKIWKHMHVVKWCSKKIITRIILQTLRILNSYTKWYTFTFIRILLYKNIDVAICEIIKKKPFKNNPRMMFWKECICYSLWWNLQIPYNYMFLTRPCKIPSFSKRQSKSRASKNWTSRMFDAITFLKDVVYIISCFNAYAGWLQSYFNTIETPKIFENENAICYFTSIFWALHRQKNKTMQPGQKFFF